MQIVTGYEGVDHVTAWQDRDLNQGAFGTDTYILETGSQMAASIITNNEIDIADGVLVMQGCQGVIQLGTFDAMTISNGTQNMLRHDLIVAEYTKDSGTGVEAMTLKVIKGTPSASNPSDPSVTSGNIQGGDSPVQVPLYRVILNGITIDSVEPMVGTVPSLSGLTSTVGSLIKAVDFSDTVNFNANEHKSVNFNVAQAGYTPIGFLRFTTGSYQIFCYGLSMSGTTATIALTNTGSATNDRSVRISILYVKA